MQFIVSINADSAAFTYVTNDERNGEPNPADGVADVLRRLADKIENAGERVTERDHTDPFVLMDINGASVGTAYFEED